MKKFIVILVSAFSLSGFCYAQIGGYSLYFDGSDDYISVSHNSNLNFTAFTIEAWIFPTGTDSKIMGKTAYGSAVPGFSMGYTSDCKLFCECKQDWGSNYVAATSTATASLNVWSHVAMTWSSGGYLKAYINGVEVISVASLALTITNSNYFVIGKAPWISPSQGIFKGRMDEVRVWNVVRTQDQIKSAMYKELAGNETGLRIYFKMSNGSGSSVTDNQTNVTANTGTINGATWKASGCFAGPKQTLNFDGTNDYVSLPASFGSAFNSLQHFSFSGWVYHTNLNTTAWGTYFSVNNSDAPYGRVVFHQLPSTNQEGYDDILISISQNTTDLYGEAYTNSNVLELNKWIHLAFVYDGTSTGNSNRLKFYVNGKEVPLIFPNNIPSSFASSFNVYNMGKHYTADYFKGGNFDEFSFWNISLTESQVREIMMKSLIGNETGLFSYYRFDYKDGTALYDITANGFTGTLTNMDPANDWISSDAFNTWIGSESSDWSTAANWSRGSVPASGENTGIYKWTSGNELTLSSSPTLNHVFFSSTSSPTLGSNSTINGNILLGRDINLNGYTITLGSSGYLYEGSYRLYGTSGTITTTRNLSALTSENIGGLGAVISTTLGMGSTTITRGHALQGGNNSISRYYDISPTVNIGLLATLVFNYNDNELNGNTESDLKLFRSTNAGVNWEKQTLSTVNTTDNTITQTLIGSFSRWTAANSNSAMPVELVSFVSSVHGKNIELKWKTSKEVNNKGFEIERKISGGAWQYAGFVVGAGNTNEMKEYSFEDKNLNTGTYSFRIKQIDFNGNYSYHNLNGTVEIGLPAKFSLSQNYPNPFNPSTKIDFALPVESSVSLKIFDITGKEVMNIINNESLKAGYYTAEINSGGLSTGVYFCRLIAGNFSSVKKIILLK